MRRFFVLLIVIFIALQFVDEASAKIVQSNDQTSSLKGFADVFLCLDEPHSHSPSSCDNSLSPVAHVDFADSMLPQVRVLLTSRAATWHVDHRTMKFPLRAFPVHEPPRMCRV